MFANRIFHQKQNKKRQNGPDTPEMTIGHVQHITVEEPASIQWAKLPSALVLDFLSRVALEGCIVFTDSFLASQAKHLLNPRRLKPSSC